MDLIGFCVGVCIGVSVCKIGKDNTFGHDKVDLVRVTRTYILMSQLDIN